MKRQVKQVTFEELCSYLGRTTRVRKAYKHMKNSYNNLDLSKLINKHTLAFYRKELKRGHNIFFRNVIRVLMTKEARKLGSLDKVTSVTIPIKFYTDSEPINIFNLIGYRTNEVTHKVLYNKLGRSGSYLSQLETRMKKDIFKVNFKAIFNYVNTINVDKIIVPVRDDNGNIFPSLLP